MVDDGRQVAGGDPWPAAHGDGAADGRLELADVAGPVVPLEDVQCIAGESRDALVESWAYRARKDSASSSTSVPRCLSGGSIRLIGADAMEELLAEPPLLDQGREVLAGGHQEPHLAERLGMSGGRPEVAEL